MFHLDSSSGFNKLTSVMPMRRKDYLRTFMKNKTLLLMCLPAIVFFIIFCYIPMPGAYVAFVNYNFTKGIYLSPFVGLQNFKNIFSNGALINLTINTLSYNLAFLITTTIGQLAIAVMLSEIGGKWFKKITQTIMFLPYFISFVVVGLFMYSFINYDTGIINEMFQSLGFNKISFYSQSAYWPFLLTFVNFWKNAGYGAVIYLGVIASLDTNLNEAAAIDGASTWQRICNVTLPGLRPTVIILTLYALGGILKGNFGLFFNCVMTNSLLYQATDVFETYVWRSLMVNFDFSGGSAVNLYQSVFGLILVLVVNWVVRRLDRDSSLF